MKDKLLVVIDMQNDFIDGALGTQEAQDIVSTLVTKIENYDGYIICTKDTHDTQYLKTQEGRNLPVVHCVKGSNGWNINDEIQSALVKRGACLSSLKRSYEKWTFGSTKLARDIAKAYEAGEISEVELVGVCTDICIIANAMLIKAFTPEIKLTVDATCCAGVTPKSHSNALAAMKGCQVNIVGWEERP